ncbi:hypothetical protein DN402_07725 [Streptomyces sp. SW4]|nr:hypothetical protein DN402_07725 [Streptomyces sp. SW4]
MAGLEDLLDHLQWTSDPDHPDLFGIRHELAWWRGEAGQTGAALAACESLHADAERILGPDHPLVLSIRHSAAHWRAAAADTTGAATAFEHLLADQRRVLGTDHPQTLATRRELAGCRRTAGRPGTVALLEQLLQDAERIIGPDAPLTLGVRADLGDAQGRAKDPPGPGPSSSGCWPTGGGCWARTTLHVRHASLPRPLAGKGRGPRRGPGGPRAAARRPAAGAGRGPPRDPRHPARPRLLAGKAGEAAAAARSLEHLLADAARVHGPDHLRTLTVQYHLAKMRGASGDAAGPWPSWNDCSTTAGACTAASTR